MARLFLFFKKRLIGDKHTQKAGLFLFFKRFFKRLV